MMFFFIVILTTSIGVSSANSPLEIVIFLFSFGIFASIYYLFGLALIANTGKNMGIDIAINGILNIRD